MDKQHYREIIRTVWHGVKWVGVPPGTWTIEEWGWSRFELLLSLDMGNYLLPSRIFFLQKRTHSISYKILQIRLVYTNPCRDTIGPSMWMPADSIKGEDDHCWIKASRCLSTPSESPLRPSRIHVRAGTYKYEGYSQI